MAPIQRPDLGIEGYRPYLRLLAQVQFDDRLQGKVDASDIVQETLLKAHQARDQFEGRTGPEMAAWLREILTNTLIDAVRRFTGQARDVALERSIQASVHDSSMRLEKWLTSDQPSPEDQAQRHERLLQVATACRSCPTTSVWPSKRSIWKAGRCRRSDSTWAAARRGSPVCYAAA